MKIVVPVKQVAALDDEFELLDDGSGVDPDCLEWELNEWDTFSLEAALELREAVGDGEVVAVTVGDEEAEEGLLSAPREGRRSRTAGSGTTRSRTPIRWRWRACWRRGRRASHPTSSCAECSPRMRSTARRASRWRDTSGCRTSRS